MTRQQRRQQERQRRGSKSRYSGVESECGYCGSQNATSDDHTPGELIYGRPLPHPRPYVRACRDCHSPETSQDDEYFRDTLLNYHLVSDLPQAQEQIAAMFRGLSMRAKRPYLDAVVRSIGKARVRTESGLYAGTVNTYRLDPDRLDRTLRRYIRGLHRFELDRRLPEDWTVRCVVKPDPIRQEVARVIAIFQRSAFRVVQPGVFGYRWIVTPDGGSVWLLVFFDAYPMMGIVYPPGKAPAEDQIPPGLARRLAIEWPDWKRLR